MTRKGQIEIKNSEERNSREYCLCFLISKFSGQLRWNEGRFAESIPDVENSLGKLGKAGKKIAGKLLFMPGIASFVITPMAIRVKIEEGTEWEGIDSSVIKIIKAAAF